MLLLVTLAPALALAVEKRPLPDYDGRDGRGQPTRPKDVALWVPRVVLYPLYFTSEYLIRRPLGFLIGGAERIGLPAAVYDFFAFGPNHTAGIVPLFFLDFGFNPSAGLYFWWDDAGFKGHDLRLRGATWGKDWVTGTATERFRFASGAALTLTGTATHRPDYVFYGTGSESLERDRSRFGADLVDVHAEWLAPLRATSSIETSIGYRGAHFRDGDFDEDPTVRESVARGVFGLPDGYTKGFHAAFARARLKLDSRKAYKGSGARLELEAEQSLAADQASLGWLRYGASVGGLLDLGDSGRIVSFSVATQFADRLGDQPVPFTELATLGGNDWMPGYRPGRLRGRSAAVATLRYSWPIWIWLHGSIQGAVGNVYGEHLRDFDVEQLRFSGAVGIESHGSSDSVLQVLFGFGTRTFEQGGAPEALRIVFGARSGF